MTTNQIVDYLKTNSSDMNLLDHLQTAEAIAASDVCSPLCSNANTSRLPQLLWDDVLQLVHTAYDIHSEHEHNILFVRSSREELPEHTHNYFEIIYVLSGTCVHSVNGNMETLQAGDLCILPPPTQHMQFKDSNSLSAKLLILPDYFIRICPGILQRTDALATFLTNCIYSQNNEQYLLIHTEQNLSVRNAILEIGKEALKDDSYSDLITSGLFMSLLIRLNRDYQVNLKSVPSRNIVHEIMTILRNEYATITLESLAQRLHYSVPYCSKYIKKLFGCNFSYLLRCSRFQIAEEYLSKSTLTINQISKMIGYENPENFMRSFKNHYHMTPTQFREQSNQPINTTG